MPSGKVRPPGTVVQERDTPLSDIKGILGVDPVLQHVFGALALPTPITQWDGMWADFPPDDTGAVGPMHYVQVTNFQLQVWSKTGTALSPMLSLPFDFWAGFGGDCQDGYAYDPVVLYDRMADRWVIAEAYGQIAHPVAPPAGVCVAVSSSGDPLGTWYRYAYQLSIGATDWIDYPKWGTWSDGYYMVANTQESVRPFVFDRAAMLQGRDAAYQSFSALTDTSHMIPADLEGELPPPVGAPEPFVGRPGPTEPAATFCGCGPTGSTGPTPRYPRSDLPPPSRSRRSRATHASAEAGSTVYLNRRPVNDCKR